MESKNLRTIKKAHQETGVSQSYFKQLLREGKLTRYKINSATYISLTEFETIAQPEVPFGTKVRAHHTHLARVFNYGSGAASVTRAGRESKAKN